MPDKTQPPVQAPEIATIDKTEAVGVAVKETQGQDEGKKHDKLKLFANVAATLLVVAGSLTTMYFASETRKLNKRFWDEFGNDGPGVA